MIGRIRRAMGGDKMKSFLRSFSFVFALRFVEKFLGFITSIILFRVLSVEDAATYNFFISIAAAFAVFSLPEMKNASIQSVARGFDGTYRVATTISGAVSLLASLILIGVASYYRYWINDELMATGFLILALFFPASSGLSHWRGYFQGRGNFSKFALVDMGLAVARLIMVFLALFTDNYNVLNALIIFFSVPAVVNSILTIFLFSVTLKTSEVEPSSLKYGLHSSFLAGLAQLANQVEKVALFTVSPPAMALFVAGERWASLLQALAQDLAAVMGPHFARRKNFDRELDKKLKFLSWGLGAISLFIAFFTFPLIIPAAFGGKYHESVWVAQLLTIAAALTYHSSFRFRYIKSKIDIRNYRNVTLVGPTFRLVAGIPLVVVWGIWGAVASVFLTNLIINLTVSWSIRSHSNE